MPFDQRQMRTEAKLQAPDGSIFRISKVSELFSRPVHLLFLMIDPAVEQGAPHVILNMCHYKDEIKARVDTMVLYFFPSSGNLGCTEFVDRQVKEISTRGIRSLAIARQDNEDGRWRLLGILTFLDPPRPDTRNTIEQARCFGLEVRQ